MNTKFSSIPLLVGIMIIPLLGVTQTQSNLYSGKYFMKTEEVELTLELIQPDEAKVEGTLSSTSGIYYSLDGIIDAGVASGICSGEEGSVFFEVYVDGMELVLSLIEPDAWNMPDYNTATYLSFTKKDDPNNTPLENEAAMNTSTEQGQPVNQPNEIKGVGNASWGFQFLPPKGWTYEQSGEAIIMGHTTIPGIILIFPHFLKDLQEVKQEMKNGIQEEGNYLMLNSGLSETGEDMLEGDYQGMMDGQQAKGHGYGTLSPYGGGAFILAISTPQMLGTEIIRDAGWIASNLIYNKPASPDLASHFAGRWASFTTNTSTWIQFYPDGTYEEQYESSYSGELSGDGNWGAAGGENSKGRWSVQGNKDQGVIIVKFSNGNTLQYEYRVHEEGGEKYYSEYWFNGKLYGKSRD